ncbi:MAG: FAD-linked oxidase C-terminal domain-containing protein [Bacillota bacterium]|nr:FAD-linked oxidase C-terminal domain-containing protein [Bacillota bacterium]
MPSDRTLAADLTRIVGRRWVLCTPPDLVAYAYDAGSAEARPDAVVLPGSRDELLRVLALCHRRRVPVVPRGAGTSLSGGPVPAAGGVVLALARLNRILSLDPLNRVAVVEPGVVNADLQRAAAPHGLGFMPDPASMTVSTLGGNAAENAGGPRAAKHGVFRRHVLGVEFALADGTLMTTGQIGLPVPCPDLPRPVLELSSLVVGSEGTLACITGLALRLAPLAGASATVLAFYPAAEAAGETVSHLMATGLVPSAAEIMGRLDIRLVNEHFGLGLPAGTEAMLLIELDGPGPGLARQIELVRSCASASGASLVETATDPADRERLWRARRTTTGLYGKVRPAAVNGDIVVPRQLVPAMFRKIEDLERSSGLCVGLVGHAGDGNLHPAVLYDPADAGEMAAAHEVNRALVEEALRLGGTMTGEHGVGLEKLEFMERAFSPATLGVFRAVKRAFDPAGLLNPGKVLPEAPRAVAAAGAAGAVVGGRGPCAADREGQALARLEGLLGSRRLLPGMPELAGFGFDDARRPAAVALPATVEEVAETVRILAAAGVPCWPLGGGGLVRSAFRPFRGGVAVSTAGMRRVLEVCGEDLTCRVEAGCSGDDLTRALALEAAHAAGAGGPGLTYPVDPWRTPRSTLGGEVAANACGPGRPRCGSTRDRLLGLTFVSAAGEVCRVGGRVVKDVAGYDVTRLICGSWGALGIVAEMTLRLEPRPEVESTLIVRSRDAEELGRAAQTIRRDVDVWGLELLSPGEPDDGRWRLLIGLAGASEDVASWGGIALRHARAAGLDPEELCPADAQAAWDEARRARGPAACRMLAGETAPWAAGYAAAPPDTLGGAAGLIHRRIRGLGWESSVVSACMALGTMDFTMRDPDQSVAGLQLGAATAALLGSGDLPAGATSGLYGWGGSAEGAVFGPGSELETGTGTAYGPALAALLTRLKTELDPRWVLAPGARALPAQRQGVHGFFGDGR